MFCFPGVAVLIFGVEAENRVKVLLVPLESHLFILEPTKMFPLTRATIRILLYSSKRFINIELNSASAIRGFIKSFTKNKASIIRSLLHKKRVISCDRTIPAENLFMCRFSSIFASFMLFHILSFSVFWRPTLMSISKYPIFSSIFKFALFAGIIHLSNKLVLLRKEFAHPVAADLSLISKSVDE